MKKFWFRKTADNASAPAFDSAEESAFHANGTHASAEEVQRERDVKEKVLHYLGANIARVPFAATVLSAYYCALDKNTPNRVRMLLFGALAYFVMPVDAIPDFLAIVGFTDDASVLLTALMAVRQHILPKHQQAAEDALERIKHL